MGGEKLKQLAEWVDLGQRLSAASQEHFAEALRLVRVLTEARELAASQDHRLLLRPRRALRSDAA
jgi:hypothetical protein